MRKPPSTPLKDFLNKIIRMRTYLIDKGYSLKNLAETQEATVKVKLWLNFYESKLTEEKIRNYCHRHMDEIFTIMPGRSSASGEALRNEFFELINKQTNH